MVRATAEIAGEGNADTSELFLKLPWSAETEYLKNFPQR
jgi:hypothetical protein